jgi:hypothetical protein
VNYSKHCRLEFGEYVQTHEEHDNTMTPGTIGALALRPIGNVQGSHLFFSLSSGRVITRNRWTVLPMPEEVVDRIRTMRSDVTNDLHYDEVEIDEQADYGNEPDELLQTRNYEANEETNQDELLVAETQITPPEEPAEEAVDDRYMSEENEIDIIDEQVNKNDLIDGIDIIDGTNNVENIGEDDQNDEQPVEINPEAEMDMRNGPRSPRYNLRPRRPRDYSHLYATIDHICLTQYNLRRGLEMFGNEGLRAVHNEFSNYMIVKCCPQFMGRCLVLNSDKRHSPT